MDLSAGHSLPAGHILWFFSSGTVRKTDLVSGSGRLSSLSPFSSLAQYCKFKGMIFILNGA